jgi:uncharacterized membrane protein YkvA (DUF1232 family)
MMDYEKYISRFQESAFLNRGLQLLQKLSHKSLWSALLLYYTYRQKQVPAFVKRMILGVLGYVLSPIDLIPDLTPFLGYTDDLGALSYALVALSAYINDESRTKAANMMHRLGIRNIPKD